MRSLSGTAKEPANNHHPGRCGKHLALNSCFCRKKLQNRKGRAARMTERRSRKMVAMLFVQAAIWLATLNPAQGQSLWLRQEDPITQSSPEDRSQPVSVETRAATDSTVPKTIVIGFVGGFAKRDDVKHPEVQFAANLRQRYPSQ